MGEAFQLGDALGGAGPGEVPLSTVSVLNQGPLRRDLFTFTNMPVPVVSVTTGAGVGGKKFFDFPPGFIKHFSTRGILTVSVAAAKQADFTDATPEGDVGVGTAAPADADALGTDATDDDFGTSTPLTMSAYSGAVTIPTEAEAVFNGSATSIDLYVNVFIDAVDIDDSTTTEVLVNGWLLVCWMNQGDV